MEPQATNDRNSVPRGWSAARRRDFFFAFVALSGIAIAAAAGATYIFHQIEDTQNAANIAADVRIRAERVASVVRRAAGDLFVIARGPDLKEVVEDNDPKEIRHLAMEFVNFMDAHREYDKLRWIDVAGKEIIRVDRGSDGAHIVPEKDRQDKSDRDYFLETRDFPVNAIYISPFDLNVEHGKIEVPWRPVLRVATPVADGNGTVAGMVVININGAAILDAVAPTHNSQRRFFILNQDGHWLSGAPHEDLFGFMFGKKKTFATENPDAWNAMLGTNSGAFTHGGAHYGFMRLRPPNSAAAALDPLKYSTAVAVMNEHFSRGRRSWLIVGTHRHDPWAILRQPPVWFLAAALLVNALAGGLWAGARDDKRQAETALRHTLESLRTNVRLQTEAFRESEERFRKAFEVAPHGMVLAKPDRTLIRVNREFANMLGYAPEELEGRDVNSVTYEDDQAVTLDTFARLKAGEPYVRYEKRYIHKDGSLVWIEGSNAMVDLGDGSPPYFVGQVIDVTEKRATLAALEQSESHLRAILDNAANAIVSIDRDGGIIDANRAAGVIFGCDEAELMGVSFSDFIPDIDPNDTNSIAHGLLRDPDGKARSIPLPGRRRNGAAFPAEVSLASIHEDDEVRLVAIVIDVTEREEIQNRLRHAQKMEAVGRLTGGIAHDFNNILTVIIGNLQLLKRTMVNQSNMARVDKVIGAAKSGADMTRRLLTFSRQQVLALDVVDINDLIEHMEDLLRRTVGEHIAITISLSPTELWGHTDANQFESAILNLCINAVDAMPDGGRLTIETGSARLDEGYARTHPEVAPGDYVVVAVSDTGTGIPPELLEHIFEPFFTTKEAGKGTGLGLSTIYGFMMQTEGHVSVYSALRHGTTFKLYVRQSQQQTSLAATSAPRATSLIPADRRILVVEDEPAVREIAVAILESAGFRVAAADSGQAALKIIDAGEVFDLIFSDIVMPGGISGVDLAQAIGSRNMDTPVLLASGYAERALRESVAGLNANHFIAKPYDADALLRKIADVLETGP